MIRRNFVQMMCLSLLGPAVGLKASSAINSATEKVARALRRKTYWVGPRGRWSDPLMWSNGVPTEKMDATIGGGRSLWAMCIITDRCDAKCHDLLVTGNAHLIMENDLYIAGDLDLLSGSFTGGDATLTIGVSDDKRLSGGTWQRDMDAVPAFGLVRACPETGKILDTTFGDPF